MKRLLWLLLFPIVANAQFVSSVHAPGFPHPSWTFLQAHFNFSCTLGNSGCNGLMYPTTANSVQIILVATTNNLTATSASVTGGGGGGTWNTCPASGCHSSIAGTINVDAMYSLNGTAGNTQYTVNLSGATQIQNSSCPLQNGNPTCVFYTEFIELLPPAGTTASIDVVGANTTSSCSTTCNGVALTTTATDGIIQWTPAPDIISPAGPFTWSGPYTAMGTSAGLALNVAPGSIAAPTFGLDPQSHGGTSFMGVIGMAFKTSAGTYTSPSTPFTWVNFATTYVLSGGHIACNPTCPAFTIPSTGNGNLLFLEMSDGNQHVIQSVNDGTNTFTVPSGPNTCQITNATVGGLSCAYLLSSTSGKTTLNVTVSGGGAIPAPNISLAYYEISRASGSFVVDAQGSTLNPTSVNVPGQSLAPGCTGCSNALTGAYVTIFQAQQASGGPDGFTLYPYPFINKGLNVQGGGWTFDLNYANTGLLLNTKNGAAPYGQTPSNPSNVTAIAFR